jgi:beta-glucosidase
MNRNRALQWMRRAGVALTLAVLAASCSSDSGDSNGDDGCDPAAERANLDCDDPTVADALLLLRAMSLEEKVQQMSGPPYNPTNFFDQEDNDRLDVPGFRYLDGPRGVRWYNSDYGTTVYPVAAARASSWDIALETQIGEACADEMRYLGRHVFLAPTVNQVMHPRWGRAQETYGEDAFLLGAMGAALVQGVQSDPPAGGHRIQACVKHLAANNIEDTRIYVNAQLDERTLREVYLPHFKKSVDAGASCVMASYNRVNGEYSGYNTHILRDILKTEWAFSGFVISDWFAKGLTQASPVAGLDIEMPFSSGLFPTMFDSEYFYGPVLLTAINSGLVAEDLIDEAVLRILHAKARFGILEHAPIFTPERTKSTATQTLAHQSAREGMVLLKNGPSPALNDDILPLDRSSLSKIAVVGMFADLQNTGDKGSSDAKVVDGSLVFTPFEGLQQTFAGPGRTVVEFSTVAGNEAALADADAIVVIAAYFFADLARTSSGEEGEWKDRESMALPARDLTNITNAVALKSSNPDLRVIVVAKSGGAVLVDDWIDDVDALIMAWFGGMREGIALGEILFGDVNPSGKVCQSFPHQASDLPAFDNANTGTVSYGYYHGYRWLDRQGITPRYPFGYGLSYTTYAYSNLSVTPSTLSADGTLTVTFEVENTGAVAGSEVAQLYVGYGNTSVAGTWGRPVKELKGFARLEAIDPGESRTATIEVDAADLAYWNEGAAEWRVERMTYELWVGPSSDTTDANTLSGTFTIN